MSNVAFKGAPKAPSESGARTLAESADKWAQFCRSADEAATTAWKQLARREEVALKAKLAQRTTSHRPTL